MSTGWSASKPCSSAVIDWSAPRGTLMVPGVMSIRYGTDASTLRDTTTRADRACRRNAGPNANRTSVASAMPPKASP
jgi:hypothetical protein